MPSLSEMLLLALCDADWEGGSGSGKASRQMSLCTIMPPYNSGVGNARVPGTRLAQNESCVGGTPRYPMSVALLPYCAAMSVNADKYGSSKLSARGTPPNI